jgi:hypothetical protein
MRYIRSAFFVLGAFLLRCTPQKPRFSGLRCRSGPAFGVAAPHPYNRLRGFAIRPAVSAPDGKIFYRQFWWFAAFLMRGVVFLLENRQYFSNISGFTPCSRLKITALASIAFFFFAYQHYSIFMVIKQLYCFPIHIFPIELFENLKFSNNFH